MPLKKEKKKGPLDIRVFLLPWWLKGKASARNAGDLGLIPGSGKSPGEGDGKPLRYSCLENPMDRGTWQVTVHGAAKNWTKWST